MVLAKFFGALFFYCVLWLPSISYFAAFQWLTGKEAAVAAGAYWGSYLLLLLIGMFYVSIGCLASALTTEQINAAIMSFVIIFGVFVLGLLSIIMNINGSSRARLGLLLLRRRAHGRLLPRHHRFPTASSGISP